MIERSTDEGKNQIIEVPVTCRLDTEEEVHVYKAGGVIQRFAQDILEGQVA